MKKAVLLILIALCSVSVVFAVSNIGVYDTSWEYNALKHNKALSKQFRSATYEIEFDDDYSFSLELDCELKKNSSVLSRNDMLSYFPGVFSDNNTFEIKGHYVLSDQGTVSVMDKNNNCILTLNIVRNNRKLNVTFPDGTVLDFYKN